MSRKGPPSKFNEVVQARILELAEAGKTIKEIAQDLGVSERIIYIWQREKPDLFQSLKNAKEIADDLVEASLFQRAIGYTFRETKLFHYQGMVVEHVVDTHIPPDVTAQIFWLKNRKPEHYRDVKNHEVELPEIPRAQFVEPDSDRADEKSE